MSDAHIIYNRYSDNLALTADAVSVDGGTVETGYDIDWILDVNAARPVRLSTLQGMFKFHWASAVRLAIVAIFHANYQEALTIHIEGNDTDSWSSRSFSTTVTMRAWRVDRFPPQPWVDLTGLSAGSYHYWRVGTQDDNAVNVAVGEIWLGATIRRLNPDFMQGRSPAQDVPQIEHQTAYRRMRKALGTTIRSVSGTIPPTSDANAQDVLDWIADANGRPFLFIPDGLAGEAWLGIHTITKQQMQDLLDHDATSFPLAVEEDGRGLEPTPSPLT